MLTAITVRGLQMSPQFVISAGLPYGLRSSVRTYRFSPQASRLFRCTCGCLISAALDNMGIWASMILCLSKQAETLL